MKRRASQSGNERASPRRRTGSRSRAMRASTCATPIQSISGSSACASPAPISPASTRYATRRAWSPAPAVANPGTAAKLNERGNLYTVAQQQLDKAAKAIKLDPFVKLILSQPKNELIVNFPVRMDSGEFRLFKGYRVQHNNILG